MASNKAASVRHHLTVLAHEHGEETEYVLMRYGLERLLYRLGRSPHADQFILKGAFLFVLWADHPHRRTRDLDLLGFGADAAEDLAHVFHDLCTFPVEDDGMLYHTETVRVEPIRAIQAHGG